MLHSGKQCCTVRDGAARQTRPWMPPLPSPGNGAARYPAHLKALGYNAFYFSGCGNAWIRNVGARLAAAPCCPAAPACQLSHPLRPGRMPAGCEHSEQLCHGFGFRVPKNCTHRPARRPRPPPLPHTPRSASLMPTTAPRPSTATWSRCATSRCCSRGPGQCWLAHERGLCVWVARVYSGYYQAVVWGGGRGGAGFE
jgi:hypothetical protein